MITQPSHSISPANPFIGALSLPLPTTLKIAIIASITVDHQKEDKRACTMSDQQIAPTPHALYCSYADADQRLKQELEKHLKILLDQRVITFWCRDQMPLGSERAQVIQEQIQAASVILLLLSPDFFDSDQCQREVEHALAKHRTGTVHIYLILVRPCPWQLDTRLQNLPILPELAHPVNLWRNRDQAW